jgi:hypothetical protein
VAISVQAEEKSARGFRLASPTDIGAPGHTIEVSWGPAAGATKAEVTSASLSLDPATVEETQQHAGVTRDGNGWIIDAPSGKRVSALSLNGFKSAGTEITSISTLPAGTRVIVAFPRSTGGGFDAPRFAAPAVGRQKAMPPTLTGASYTNRLLRIEPSVEARRVRIAVVTGSNPLDFAEQATELATVHVTTETAAKNVKVLSPDHVPIWQTPEFAPETPTAEIDLRAALETALNSRLNAKQLPSATFTVIADAPAKALINGPAPRGFLVRTQDGVLRVTSEGDPAPLGMSEPLAGETPSTVTGDLVLRYDRMRILETISDALPRGARAISGWVAGDQAIIRELPAEVFKHFNPARIGVYGRAPEDCEISIELVRVNGDVVADILGPPAVTSIPPDSLFRTRWADVPSKTEAGRANGVRVRANRGRFFWAASDADKPLIRVAVHDPDPGGRPVFLGSTQLAELRQASLEARAFRFPVEEFRAAVPELTSDLFLTADFTDLTLRYAR